MKATFSLLTIFVFSNFFSQELQSNKIKIGKYKYEIYLKGGYNYEVDEYGISYYIRLNDKENSIGPFLSYRTFLRSRNAPVIDEKLPPNPLLKFKDREVTGQGKIEIKKEKREIVNTFIRYIKTYESDADSTRTIYKQGKNGFFNPVFIAEYNNGIEKITLKK